MITQGWECLPVTNTLAYWPCSEITNEMKCCEYRLWCRIHSISFSCWITLGLKNINTSSLLSPFLSYIENEVLWIRHRAWLVSKLYYRKLTYLTGVISMRNVMLLKGNKLAAVLRHSWNLSTFYLVTKNVTTHSY